MAYTSLTDIEAELKLAASSFTSTSTPSDTQVYAWISNAEDRINNHTGNIYSNTLVSSQVYDFGNEDGIIRIEPFTSITTLSYNAENAGVTPVWTDKTEDTDFYTYGEEGEIEPITSVWSPLSGSKRFRITYFKGMSKVPGRIKDVAAMMVANKVVSATTANQAAEQSGGSVQVGTIKIDDPTAFSVSAFRTRDQEVKDFFSEELGTFKTFRITRNYDGVYD